MLITRKQQIGISLIELMIGLLVGLIIVAGGINVFSTSVRGQADNIKIARLNQDMRTMIDIMARDIRRAGFVTSDPEANWTSLQDNPFFDETTFDETTFDETTELAVYNPGSTSTSGSITITTGSCIVYAYNRYESDDKDDDEDGRIDVEQHDRLGFRLVSGNLEMRSSGTTNANCADETGTWEPITEEEEVEITGLTFTLTSTTLNASIMTTDTDGDGCYDGDDQDPATASASCKTGTYGNGLCDTGEACNTCIRDGSPDDPACLYVRNVMITLTGRLHDDNTVTQTITEQVRVRNDKYLAPIP